MRTWRGATFVELERDGEIVEVLVSGAVTGAVACVEMVQGLDADDELTGLEEDYCEAELLAAAKREALRQAERVPACVRRAA